MSRDTRTAQALRQPHPHIRSSAHVAGHVTEGARTGRTAWCDVRGAPGPLAVWVECGAHERRAPTSQRHGRGRSPRSRTSQGGLRCAEAAHSVLGRLHSNRVTRTQQGRPRGSLRRNSHTEHGRASARAPSWVSTYGGVPTERCLRERCLRRGAARGRCLLATAPSANACRRLFRWPASAVAARSAQHVAWARRMGTPHGHAACTCRARRIVRARSEARPSRLPCLGCRASVCRLHGRRLRGRRLRGRLRGHAAGRPLRTSRGAVGSLRHGRSVRAARLAALRPSAARRRAWRARR